MRGIRRIVEKSRIKKRYLFLDSKQYLCIDRRFKLNPEAPSAGFTVPIRYIS